MLLSACLSLSLLKSIPGLAFSPSMCAVVRFVFAPSATVGVCIQRPLGLGCPPMGQFSVQLALCH